MGGGGALANMVGTTSRQFAGVGSGTGATQCSAHSAVRAPRCGYGYKRLQTAQQAVGKKRNAVNPYSNAVAVAVHHSSQPPPAWREISRRAKGVAVSATSRACVWGSGAAHTAWHNWRVHRIHNGACAKCYLRHHRLAPGSGAIRQAVCAQGVKAACKST